MSAAPDLTELAVAAVERMDDFDIEAAVDAAVEALRERGHDPLADDIACATTSARNAARARNAADRARMRQLVAAEPDYGIDEEGLEPPAFTDPDEPFVRTSPKGNLRGILSLATVDGEHVEAAPASLEDDAAEDEVSASLGPDLLAWEQQAYDAGRVELAAAVRRERLGMSRPDLAKLPPVDLWRRHEAPPLPDDCLPAVIHDFAVEQGRIMGADPVGLALSALAVCASAIDDAIVVQMKAGDASWKESARLWIGLVGMPSTKKSPIMSAALRPLRSIDRDMASRNSLAMADWQRLPKKGKDETPQPPQPRRIVEDATVEALQEVLKDCPHGVLSAQDELSGWFGAMDKYSPGKGAQADRAFWLRAFNGGPYSVHRVGRGASYVPNLSISVVGGIQPEPLRKLVGDSLDDGLIQRFIPVILRPATAGLDEGSPESAAAYGELVRRLTALKPPRGEGNLAAPQPLRFAPDAQAVRRTLELEHVELVEALESASPKMAAHLGKHDGVFGRLAVLWHCVEHADRAGLPVEISGDTAFRVARFMREWLRPSAVAFYAGQLGMSAGHEDLMAVASLIVSDALAEVDARTIQRSTRALRHVGADEARRLCEKLEAFGWLEPIEARQKTSARWRVIRAVHDLFAERGREEAARRERARAAFAEAFSG